jgi:hypothetical protein
MHAGARDFSRGEPLKSPILRPRYACRRKFLVLRCSGSPLQYETAAYLQLLKIKLKVTGARTTYEHRAKLLWTKSRRLKFANFELKSEARMYGGGMSA